MSVKPLSQTSSIRQTVSESEWQLRGELAAAYRLMDDAGITDLTQNHICVRLPDEPDTFLIKQHHQLFEEVTASNLVKYDLDGNPRQDGFGKLTGGGLIIHAGLFAARPDLKATIHTHTAAIIGVSCHKTGLLPINQHAMHFLGKIAYHDFGGFEFDMSQRDPLVRSLGDKKIAFLRNHGSLVCGDSLGEAFIAHHQLEIACQGQIAALAAGENGYVLVSQASQAYADNQINKRHNLDSNGGKNWQALLRRAERLFPDYKN